LDRNRVKELHYITPIPNLPSIFDRGLLSNYGAQKFPHISVALTDVQEKREPRIIPGGLRLHEYVNMYFNARNPMMYRLLSKHQELAVLSISASILDLPDAVIADGNASSEWTSFRSPKDGLPRLREELVFAEYWTDPDPITYYKKKSAICAEVLIPHHLPAEYINNVYTSGDEARNAVKALLPTINPSVNARLFFRGSKNG
jgi:hypothetical protein